MASAAVFAINQSAAPAMSFCSGYMMAPGASSAGSVDITAAQKTAIGKLTPRKTTPFAGHQPGDYSHWNTEPSGPWNTVSPRLAIEVRYDHFIDCRFRHDCTFSSAAPRQGASRLPIGRRGTLVLNRAAGCNPTALTALTVSCGGIERQA
jgi:hypothetical protein